MRVVFVVDAMKYLSEGAFTDIFLYFEPVGYVVPNFTYIFTFVIVEATVFRAIWCLQSFTISSLFCVYVVDLVKLQDFSSLVVK